MHGLIGSMTASAGNRDALVEILLESSQDMPGCLSYIVAIDRADDDRIWITEVWDSQQSHANSLTLPAVRAAIKRAMPIIAGFGNQTVTTPIGGQGLSTSP